jgi:Amt family ammonium transporter
MRRGGGSQSVYDCRLKNGNLYFNRQSVIDCIPSREYGRKSPVMIDHWVMLGVAALLLRVGFALYAAGISRSKNTISALFRAVVEIAVGFLAYWILGSEISGSWRQITHSLGPEALFLGGIFLTAPAIIAGATVERSRPILGIAAAVIMPGLVTPVAWRLLQSKWFVEHGLIDQAGAISIHFSAGLAALMAVLALGPRLGKYNRDGSTNAVLGHSHPLAVIGIFLILTMWIPYVAAFALNPADAAFNVVLAGSAGVVAAVIYCSIRYGRQDVFLVYAAMLGAIVSITAGAGSIDPPIAAAIGAAAGIIVPYFVVRLDMIWKIDDPAGGITIHGLCGLFGSLAVALLASGTVAQRAQRLEAAVTALAMVGLLTVCVTGGIFFLLRATAGIRVREADEFDGLDLAEYDLNAYPDFQQTTIKSYHLREM